MIVNENIIRNALNESIDEFLLEEGAFDGLKNWWNNSANGQRVKNGLSSVWNNVKNAAAMYMDKQTNGQWNNKYGIYANGNGKTTELYYLNKWFKFHLDEIRRLDYKLMNPSNSQGEIEWTIDPKTGDKVGKEILNKFDSIEKYVAQNVTPQNFNGWIRNFIKDRNAILCIDEYIKKCSSSIKDLNSAMDMLSVGSFMADDAGQKYIKNGKGNLEKSAPKTKKVLQKESATVSAFLNQLRKFLWQYSNDTQKIFGFMSGEFENYFNRSFAQYINSYDNSAKQRINLVKNYIINMWGTWGNYIMKNPSNINYFLNQLNYTAFKNNTQGKQFIQLQQQSIY